MVHHGSFATNGRYLHNDDDPLEYDSDDDGFGRWERDPYNGGDVGQTSDDYDDPFDEEDEEEEEEEEALQEHLETSSVESRRFRSSITSVYTGTLVFDRATSATPEAFERSIKDLTIPRIQNLLRLWGLSRTGNKAALVEKLMSRLRPLFAGHDRPQFNLLVEQLNEEYVQFRRGRRPFAPLPDPDETIRLLEASRKFDFDYSLPFPWILEEKVSLPMVSAFVEQGSQNWLRVDFLTPNVAGARYLLVALKLYRDPQTKAFLPYGQSNIGGVGLDPSVQPPDPQPPYRHAYVQSFRCDFNGAYYSPQYNSSVPSKVHEITRLLRQGLCSMDLHSFGAYNGRDYYFQIVRARRDPAHWLQVFQQFTVKSSQSVLTQLRQDFGERDGISTASITVSLRCPLSLLRLTTPLRSSRCKHPQCFDFASWSQSVNLEPSNATFNTTAVFRCPICDLPCTPDGMYVDGLAQEMLQSIQDTTIEEACIDVEAMAWKPVLGKEQSHSKPIVGEDLAMRPVGKRKKTLDVSHPSSPSAVIDLTETPDDSYFGCADIVLFKADPGAPILAQAIEIPSDGFEAGPVLDEADVVTSVALPLLRLMVPAQPPRRPIRGSSISDAIVID